MNHGARERPLGAVGRPREYTTEPGPRVVAQLTATRAARRVKERRSPNDRCTGASAISASGLTASGPPSAALTVAGIARSNPSLRTRDFRVYLHRVTATKPLPSNGDIGAAKKLDEGRSTMPSAQRVELRPALCKPGVALMSEGKASACAASTRLEPFDPYHANIVSSSPTPC